MYTKAIRKIYESKNGDDFLIAKASAYAAGYEALSYKDIIYILDGLDWAITPFNIRDFEVK